MIRSHQTAIPGDSTASGRTPARRVRLVPAASTSLTGRLVTSNSVAGISPRLGTGTRCLDAFGPRPDGWGGRSRWATGAAGLVWAFGCLLLWGLGTTASAQDENYVPAIRLVPDSAAGMARIPSVPNLVTAWEKTNLAALAHDPAMQPFIEFQKSISSQKSETLGFEIGIRPEDLLDVATGEAVAMWLPFEDDPRRPYAVAMIVDIRGNEAQARGLLEQVDKDLKAAGATRQVTMWAKQEIRRYSLKPLPGQLKVDEVAITMNEQRLIATDRESVLVSLLESATGKDTQPKLERAADYIGVQEQTANRAGESPDATVGLEWFARPIAMGRIVKEVAKIDRGRQVNILNLLERQGFDAVAAVGGRLTLGEGDFDLRHTGFIWAPPIPGEPDRYRLAARMLRAINVPDQPIPAWVGPSIASFAKINWELSKAFWYAETLVDDAVGEPLFQDLLDGIRDDQLGPQIDIAKDVIPNLGEHVIILSDNVAPADLRSERMLVAIETTDATTLRQVVRKTMEVDPDATIVPSPVSGVEVYRVLRTEEPIDFEAELFSDLGIEADEDAPAPLLNEWAITVLDDPSREAAGGKTPGYLVFSSHPELMLETVERLSAAGPQASLGETPEMISLRKHLEAFESEAAAQEGHAIVRMARTDLTLRAKYSLMREGKLRDSDSVMASLFRRIFISKDDGTEDLGTDKLPPFEQIQKYFRPAAGISQATPLGWTLDGFLLK